MSFKCQIFTTRLTFHNVLELSCDVRIIILFSLIAILPPNIKCAKLPNPQIRLLINDEDLLHEKTSRHEAGSANVQPEHSGEHFNLYRSELKRLSYETIHRILRDENEPSYRREDTELRYYQKRSPSAYEDNHQLIKRSTTAAAEGDEGIALNYSKRKLKEFITTPQLEKELNSASSLDLSDNHLSTFSLSLLNDRIHTLNLSNNTFSSIPLSENTTLKSLNLNANSIRESALPSNVYLRNLYLSSNNIENLAAVNLSLLKNLEILDISCNRLRSLETSFFPQRMHNLKHLNLAHNQLGTVYRETFYNLLSLNTLLLAHNNITDIDYETFLALPNLQYLDLSFNRLKGKSIRALQGITGLVALNIAFNAELGPYMQEFVASWSLKELDASGTGLCQIPAALAQSVRSLKLTHNWLKVINCGDLDSYPLLQYLDLSFSHIEHIEDDALGRLEILEVLMLDHNQLTKIPLSLPVSLEHLFLQNNNIMDIQSQSFQGLSSLKTLDLSHNKLLYLPDVSLPKLLTLNLQSAEIRGISQGIVHTLPRLTELFLEDNPIKCSDLLGIAEWASTCRLRSTKEEMQENEGAELADEEGMDNEGKVELKRKFEKMHNFYDKFAGEHCQKHRRNEEVVATKPSCAAKEEQATQTVQSLYLGASQLENNLKRSSVSALEPTKVVNFNLNSMIAIPLPAKKAVKTLTETANKTTTADDEVNAATAKPITSATPPTPTPTATATTTIQIKGNPTLNNNKTKTYNVTKTSAVTTISTTPAEATKPVEEFAFKDKRQEHSNQAKKTFARTTTADVASFTETTATATATATAPTPTATPTAIKGIAIEIADKASIVEELLQEQVVAVESSSAESLRAANLQEALKQTAPESIIKKDIKEQTTMAYATTTTQMPPATAVDIAETHATAINSPKPETAATMTTTETITAASTPTGTTLSSTTTAAEASRATSKSKINLFKENLQNEKEIKTKIGPTKQIKSFVTSFTAPALPPPASTTTATATTIASSQTSFPTVTSDGPPSQTTTNKELSVSTTSRTVVVVQANPVLSTLSSIPSTASFTPTTNVPTMTATSQTLTTSGGDTAIILGPLQPTFPSTSIEVTAAAAAIATIASFEDKELASNKDTSIGQDNSRDNWNGQDNNKTLVPLHITTPITPHVVLHSNENRHSLEKDPHPQPSQHQRQQSGQVSNVEQENAAIQHQALKTTSNDVNAAAKCMQSNTLECTSARPQRHEETVEEEEEVEGRDIGKMPATMETTTSPLANQTAMPTQTMTFSATTTTTPAAVKISASTATTAGAATSSKPAATPHKHEPLQLHIKDRHLIGTPLLMHKGDNLMVAADEIIKPNSSQDPHKAPNMIPTTPLAPSTSSVPPPATGSSQTQHHELIRKAHTLDKSQNQMFQEPKTLKAQRHHEPLEHKGETIKDKDYVQYKKSNADMKTKKPSLIMKKMTIITKQHEAAAGEENAYGNDENEIHHHKKDLMTDSHYQELKPLPKDWAEGPPKHSTVNTPINTKSSLLHEPQTFQHEHELMLQQILHDQQQQQQHGKASQSEQWSDLRKTTDKDNHPGLILLVSSGLFVVLLLGLMHVYRCDVPWRRNSPAHHLRPHQRHNGSLDDDVHSFLSYNEGMQKWHHSTRLEAPYSSPLHNLHVRELQKTSATEKAATFKAASSYNRHLNRTHILPRTNSQSSSATTRTTSPSSSAILDDETFYIEMTPSTGQFAQALQSELLPMELLNMAQTTKQEITETSADFQFALEEDVDFNAATSTSLSTAKHHVATRSDLLADTSSASAASATATSFNHSNKTLYNTRKFGLW